MAFKDPQKARQWNYNYKNSERGYMNETICGIFGRARKKDRKSRQKWTPDCTKQEIYDELMLYIQDHGRNCEYCKEPWTYQRALGVRGQKNTARKRAGVESNFSIDRLDSTKTYKQGNIVFCCVGCNNRKNQVRLSDVVNILRVYIKRKVSNTHDRQATK